MIIRKILNPNTILAVDEDKKEYAFFGKGIGYSRKIGQAVDDEEINRVFIPVDNRQIQEYLRLFDSIPAVYFDITQQIIKKAEKLLNTKLNTSLFFTLSDHLNFSIERHKNGLNILNRVFWEIKNYYPIEFSVGEYALKLLKKELGQILPQEEAANVAFHIINAQTIASSTSKGLEYAKLVGGISDIVKYELKMDFDREDVHYQRFITHLKFFVERYYEGKMITENDSSLFEQIAQLYPKALTVAFNVKDYIEIINDNKVTKEEVAYLTVHINRLMSNKKLNNR
ncbi:PRD domain-containing protein [Enterococcus faecalis]|uniref:PRD domain-containing protein n=1 Tax=Enterococcus faecalis TaxID=1351 RepID=UPI00214A442A|nr:PRD domain-containing protein [Enterococcus faecalis]MCR1937028.1 PRD domain-containing protein [Enterococcus faecalis]